MNFSFRPTTLADIKPSLPLIFDRFAFSTRRSLDDLAAFWRYLLTQGLAISAVCEEQLGTTQKRIVGIGMSLFVTDKFAQECKTTLPPYTSFQIVQRWKAKQRVFLDLKEIGHANTLDGLNVLILHYGTEKTADPDRFARINNKMGEAFFTAHAGYNMKEFLYEVYGETEISRQSTNGFLVRRDYHEILRPQARNSPNAPYFLGITRKESLVPLANFGISQIFSYNPPRFGFSPAEKKLLHRSLIGESDQEMADSLGLSIWTVKKGWQKIYNRVQKTDPGLLQPEKDAAAFWEELPGAQRRRRLLEYLRVHMEEIRPGLPPRRGPLPRAKK
jgi:DNA-binding CsgD family transcriptional regulator